MKPFRLPADDLEYSVLAALWALQQATVRELHERSGVPAGRAYTTTAKAVDRLRDKGLITRERQNGAYVYRPRVAADTVERARARQLMKRFLGPNPHTAAAALVDAVDDIDPAWLAELERAIRDKRRTGHGT